MSKFTYQKSKLEHKLPRKDKKTRNSKKRKKRAKKRKAILRRIKRQQEIFTENTQFVSTIMSGECYWKNYMNVCNWQQHCLNYYGNQSETPNNQESLFSNWNEWRDQVVNESFADEETCSYIPEENYSSDDEPSELTFVIPDEMLEFMEIHMRHKEEMRVKREKELASQNLQPGQCTISERDNIEECLAPQEKSVDVKRIEEMKDLYGSSAPMIMGMETSIQLNFNRNCDIYKPSYWPILPFKFKFS